MEGYKRIVVEVPAKVKHRLDTIVGYKGKTIKDFIIGAIESEYLEIYKAVSSEE